MVDGNPTAVKFSGHSIVNRLSRVVSEHFSAQDLVRDDRALKSRRVTTRYEREELNDIQIRQLSIVF